MRNTSIPVWEPPKALPVREVVEVSSFTRGVLGFTSSNQIINPESLYSNEDRVLLLNGVAVGVMPPRESIEKIYL